jgi:hypothetical protein
LLCLKGEGGIIDFEENIRIHCRKGTKNMRQKVKDINAFSTTKSRYRYKLQESLAITVQGRGVAPFLLKL